MKILNYSSFISEKKSISPLTIRQIKQIGNGHLPKTLKDFNLTELPTVSKNNNLDCDLLKTNQDVIDSLIILENEMK